MATLGLDFHYGIHLLGTSAQLSYTDTSAATSYDILIPAGQYFLKHDDTNKDLLSVIEALINALPAITGFSFTLNNDRQVEFGMDAAADTMQLSVLTNDDNTKLAAMLGLYDNTGDLTYFETSDITDGYIMPNTLTSWFANGGRVFDVKDLQGFDEFDAEIYETEGGETSYVSGSRKAVLGNVVWTGIEGDAVRGGWPFATQTVAGVTLNATWTTSIWRALNPELNIPSFYAEVGDTPDKYHFNLRQTVRANAATQFRPGYSEVFDLKMNLSRIEL